MWVARDKEDNVLALYIYKPIRKETYWTHDERLDISRGRWMYLPKDMFPDLKWEDEPLEVNIITI